MKLLLIISAVIEVAAGASLLILPGFTTSMLMGTPLDTPTGLAAGRIAGAALAALGIACWNARNGERDDGPAKGVVAAMLFYNFAAVLVLLYAGIRLGLLGPLLWPTIVLHVALGGWCAVSLWFTRTKSNGN